MEALNSLIGNREVKGILTRLVKRGESIPSTYLFEGPRGVGKGLFARAFAECLVAGNKLDLHILEPQGKAAVHSIESMRDWSAKTHLPPTVAPYKVFLIDEAERMPATSANALLKTIEEPPRRTIVILVSSKSAQLLPTIRSRCCRVAFAPISADELAQFLQKSQGISEQEAVRISKRSGGSVSRALKLAKEGEDLCAQAVLHVLSHVGADYCWISDRLREISGNLEGRRQAVLKESEDEGSAARLFFDEVDQLLEAVGLWFRDVLVWRATEEADLLTYPERAKEIAEARPLPLEGVQVALDRSRTAIQRFTRLEHALESLLFELNSL